MSLNFLRNRRRPQIFNPREQASRLQVSQLEADEILSVVSQSQQFQQASTNNNPPSDMATKTYVDTKTNQLKTEILGGASSAYDTLLELQTELENNDSVISSITNTLSNKVNTNDLTTNYYNKTESDARYATPSQITTLQGQIDTNTSNISTNTSNISDLTNSINALNTKTNSLSMVGDVLTINSKLNITAGATGSIQLGDASSDTISIIGRPTFSNGAVFQGSITGLTKSDVGLTNVNNTSDLNKPLSTATTNALSLKADKTSSLYQNSWYVNCGVNLLSNVLSSIGSNQAQTIYISAGEVNDTSGNIITQTNTTIVGVDSAFSSPSSLIRGDLTLSGSTMTRCRVSNIGFTNNVLINGTQGRHNFKACVFSGNITIQGTTTNWVNFHYCTFSGQVNIPNTFAGYIIFYFCDFTGATLIFNNVSNQQIYINSCVNLPSLSLNALLNGFNTTISASAINTTTLNCSGSVSLQEGSVSQSSVNGLTSSLNSKLNITDATNTYATISNLTTTNNNLSTLSSRVGTNETDITNLQQKTNVLNYDNVTDTLSINSKLSVVKDSGTNNGVINLGDGVGTDVINIRSNISSNSQTITPQNLGFISGLTSNAQSQISNRVTLNTSQNITGQKNFTGGLLLNSVNLSDTISDIQTKNSSQDASISSINTSISNLENNKANITYVDQQISNIFNNPDVNMNSITELVNALNSDSNYATTISNALSLKANDNEVVKLGGNQEISGTKNFTGAIQISGNDLNTRITEIESVNTSQASSINTLNTNVSDLQSKTSAITYNSGTDTLSISSKVNINKDINNNGNVYLGDGLNNDIIYLQGSLNVGTITITRDEISRLQNVSSNIQSQLNSRVNLTTAQTISGLKNFTASGGLQINGNNLTSLLDAKQNNLVFDNAPTESSNNSLTSGSIFNTLTSYLTSATASSTYQTISGMSNYLTSATASSTYQTISGMSSYLTSASASSTYQTISGMSSYLTTATASSTYQTISGMSSYLTTSTASSTYQTISGMSSYLTSSSASSTYFGLSSNNTISGRNTFSNMNTFGRVCESINQSGSGTNLTLDFNNLTGGIIFYAPSANFTLSLNNIPTTNTNCIYTLTLRYSTRFYATAININGSSITMTAISGLSNLSINSSASFVYQTITIIFNNSSTASVSTGLMSLW